MNPTEAELQVEIYHLNFEAEKKYLYCQLKQN